MNLRSLLVATGLLLLFTQAHGASKTTASATATNAALAQPKTPLRALPVAIPAPAFVNAVTFDVVNEGEKHTLTVVSAPGLTRIDVPTDRLSVIYDASTEHYTGLEHSNYTWWEFSWPEVRAAVQNTTRYATRMRDVGPELMEENNPAPSSSSSSSDGSSSVASTGNSDIAATTDPNAPTDTAGDDDTGYVWHPTTEKKRIAGYDCVHWIGETVAGEKIDAWCIPTLVPEIETAIKTLQAINEPMALVPVRDLMPPLTFVAWKALTKGGSTPVQMAWGSSQDVNHFQLVSVKQRDGKLSYFQVPSIYVKTTLVTMDGIGNQKAPGKQKGDDTDPFHNPLLKKP